MQLLFRGFKRSELFSVCEQNGVKTSGFDSKYFPSALLMAALTFLSQFKSIEMAVLIKLKYLNFFELVITWVVKKSTLLLYTCLTPDHFLSNSQPASQPGRPAHQSFGSGHPLWYYLHRDLMTCYHLWSVRRAVARAHTSLVALFPDLTIWLITLSEMTSVKMKNESFAYICVLFVLEY